MPGALSGVLPRLEPMEPTRSVRPFEVISEYTPSGDQPAAIERFVRDRLSDEFTIADVREAALGASDSLIGKVLKHYKVLSVVGEGGMALVYKARDERNGPLFTLRISKRWKGYASLR